ncbi:MAG: three-Cys-motif partner protein TcmP [Parvularcula sp.]|jgi:three-Cys-motif partner protein|nr:three-Cys-motif partner protein TcmP [Parvularcula sp.]
MAGKVIHHEVAFDEGTKTKLFIYEKYLQAWLQVFLHSPFHQSTTLQIYDFFCGPGADRAGTKGSPIILMDELAANEEKITAAKDSVRVYFNDIDHAKVSELRERCQINRYPWSPVFSSKDFAIAFGEEIGGIGVGPSLVFMDQFGVKHVTERVFRSLAECPNTDLLFFIASDFKRRFGDLLSPELDISEAEMDRTPRHEIHRLIASRYKRWAPHNYHVGHFSIMKDNRIYGLVFGTGHWRGMEKFIDIAWKLDPECGDANFPIEAERDQGVLDFSGGGEVFRKRKLELFKDALREKISGGHLKTDGDVFHFCLTNGISPSRGAGEIYKEMKAQRLLIWTKGNGPRYSSASVKEPRILVLQNGR